MLFWRSGTIWVIPVQAGPGGNHKVRMNLCISGALLRDPYSGCLDRTSLKPGVHISRDQTLYVRVIVSSSEASKRSLSRSQLLACEIEEPRHLRMIKRNLAATSEGLAGNTTIQLLRIGYAITNCFVQITSDQVVTSCQELSQKSWSCLSK